jgi:hypothetical protein
MDLNTWVLIVGCLTLSAIAGAGIFQALFVMPAYFAAPPASLEAFQNDRSFVFWVPLQVVSLVALIAALVSSDAGSRMTAIWVSAACYLVNWVITGIFFIPGVVAFNKVDPAGPPSPELAKRGRTWLRRSWGRHVLTVGAAVALLVAAVAL